MKTTVGCLAASCLTASLCLSNSVWADTRTVGAGGTGGGPFEASCGASWALRGLEMRGGSWVDSVKPDCIGSSSANIDAQVDEKVIEPSFGGPGGGPKRLFCYKNTAVRGLRVTDGMLTDHIRGVTGIDLVCGSPDGRGGPVNQAYGSFRAPNKPNSNSQTLSCPTGQIATGIYGRSGKWVDQIGLVCGPPRTH